MTQTPTNPEPDELDSALIGFANELIAYYERCEKNGSPILFIHKYVARRKKRMQAILEKEALKARLDELQKLFDRADGDRSARKYTSIVEQRLRILRADLEKQLGSK